MALSIQYKSYTQICSAIQSGEQLDSDYLAERIEAVVAKLQDVKSSGDPNIRMSELNLDICKKVTLEELALLQRKDESYCDAIIRRLGLTGYIIALGEDLFLNALRQKPLIVLADITLEDLVMVAKRNFMDSSIWYALMNPDALYDQKIQSMGKAMNVWPVVANILNVTERLNLVTTSRYAQMSKRFWFFETVDFPVGQFRCFSGKELQSIASKIRPEIFHLVSDSQFNALDLNSLTPEQIAASVLGDGHPETSAVRLQKLNPAHKTRLLALKLNETSLSALNLAKVQELVK